MQRSCLFNPEMVEIQRVSCNPEDSRPSNGPNKKRSLLKEGQGRVEHPHPRHFAGSWWAGKAKCSCKALLTGRIQTLLHLQALQAELHACNTQTCNTSDTCTSTDMRKTKHQLRTYFPLRHTHNPTTHKPSMTLNTRCFNANLPHTAMVPGIKPPPVEEVHSGTHAVSSAKCPWHIYAAAAHTGRAGGCN